MASSKIVSVNPTRFLVIRLGSLGDIVHTIPAVAALRRDFPDARIDWVVEQRWSPLIEMVTVVDDAVPLQRSLSGQLACISQMRRAHYDCAVDFQGLYKSALLGWFSGAPRRVGRDRRAAREPGATWFYTDGVNPQGRHVAQMSLSVAVQAATIAAASPAVDHAAEAAKPAALTAEQPDKETQFPMRVPEAATRDLSAKLALEGVVDYVVLSPGGGWVSKCWPPERYGALCAQLWRRRKIRCIVNAGPGEEELALEVLRTADDAKPLALTAPLLELAALLAQAQLVVAADTGPLHLAAALGARVVALFGPTDELRNGPLPRGRVVRASPTASTDSAALGASDQKRGDYTRGDTFSPEMMNLTVEQVLAAVEEELGAGA
jgi:lipopolysaccharide heptosyltransferase I